ncbi:tyrosine kinase receptor Cad96Ca isoform X1 [Leptopilina heterotoma]|uniref:tyrosine kinase receptor Cad96Ca isoform X1 n=2 Tax=Leptopilina heterotoma TaxID=63436 RepID=UPI001CA9F06E|nr:tyrosine kinase receptor Cad96Ca isoform X1 [Leptopilina heterotoma]
MFFLWIFLTCLFFGTDGQFSNSADNTPPVMWFDRNIRLWDTDPIGHQVIKVRAEDSEDDDLTFSLEKKDADSQESLPFSINNMTGIVVVNETLQGRGGQELFFYVTVSDGKVALKSEAYAVIQKNETESNAGHTRSPFQQGPGGRMRPPILKLPNLSGYPRPPIGQLPTLQPSSIEFPQPVTKPRTTKLQPQGGGKFDENEERTSTVFPAEDAEANEIEGHTLSTKVAPSEAPQSQFIAMTFIPVAAVCILLLIFGAGTWFLRNRFCGSRKSKEDTKEQASVSVSNISDDPSLVLKRWGGPKARNNRYEPWEKESRLGIQNKSHKDKWEFPRHRLKVFSILGEGCFGQVWKYEAIDIDGIPGPTIVAVKTLKENVTERERLDFAQELKVMKSLEPHPNVVRLLGCCTEREPMFIILEYISGGKLQSFLRASREERNHGKPGLTSRDLTGFVYQISKGMEYLASKGIIHRDLAARNILIDENRACKVADFGFARDVAANQIYERKSEGRLPIRWMAPESLYDNIFSVKSDIWSFGVLIWEIVTLGSTPYPGLGAAEVMRRIKEGYRLDRPEHCKRELYNIMYYCWDKDPACRPSFGELVNLTEGLLLDETDYIELDRFPDHSYYNVLNLSGEKL